MLPRQKRPPRARAEAPAAPRRAQSLPDLIGKPPVGPSDDPAWQLPRDPLSQVSLAAQATTVHREVPLVTIATGWDVPSARAAMNDLVAGIFDAPAQLADSVMRSDSRVSSGLNSRLAILGRPVDFVIPRKYRDSDLARECRDALEDAWPVMSAEPFLGELQRWQIMMGFGVAQILWDTSGEYAIPHPLVWHPRYTYYHWNYRCYVAITLDGQEPIMPGNASWILHAPNGPEGYRSWMRGAIGPVTPWWLARHFALRDWARYSERHGLPMIKAKTPAVGDPRQQAIFRASLATLGQETVLHLPQNPQPQLSYDVDLLEARDTAHAGFQELIERCDIEITLSLLAQNLTSEVKEGSFAAARVHADVRQSLLECDARALSEMMYRQLARPFAAMNFGNPDLAPRVVWNVKPYEDDQTAAQTFKVLADGLFSLRQAGFEPKDVKDVVRLAESFGLKIGRLRPTAPLQVEVKEAGTPSAMSPGPRALLRFAQPPLRVATPRERFAALGGGDEAEVYRELEAMMEAQRAERGRRRRAA